MNANPALLLLFVSSLGVHALLIAALVAMPSGNTLQLNQVEVYRVNVVEAPSRPNIKRLPSSSAAKEVAPQTAVAKPQVDDQTIDLQNVIEQPQPDLSAQEVIPQAEQPTNEALFDEQVDFSAVEAESLATNKDDLDESLDKLVKQVKVKFEPQAAQVTAGDPKVFGVYINSLRQAAADVYTFPGNFSKGLEVRMRVIVAKDGSIKDIITLKSSGNEQFDYAALLSLRRTKFPPIPPELELETIQQDIVFYP